MTEKTSSEPPLSQERAGPARDFAAFAELERERRRNSDKDFDADVFREAIALVLSKIDGLGAGDQGGGGDDHQ